MKLIVNVAEEPMLRLPTSNGETNAHPSGMPENWSFVLLVLSSPVFFTVTDFDAVLFWVMLKLCMDEVIESVYFLAAGVLSLLPGLFPPPGAVVVVVLTQVLAEQPLLHSLASHVPELHEYLCVAFLQLTPSEPEIGRASCRERE